MATVITPYGTVQLAAAVRYTPEQIVNLPNDTALQFMTAFGLKIPQCPRFQILSVLARNGLVDNMEPTLLTSYLKYLLDVEPAALYAAVKPRGVTDTTLPRWTLIQVFRKVGAVNIYPPPEDTVRAVDEFERSKTPTVGVSRPSLVPSPQCYDQCYLHPNPHESRLRLPVGPIRYLYPVPARLDTEDIRARRWRVYTTLVTHCGHSMDIITTDTVRRTFEAIDLHFFGGYIMARIRELNSTLAFKLSKATVSAGSCGKQGNHYHIKMSETIFRRIFSTAGEKILQADLNIHSSTRLGCWIPTMEHELIHLLMFITPQLNGETTPYKPHGACFQELAAAIFDHNGIYHFLTYGDIENIDKMAAARSAKVLKRELECAQIRAQLKVGDAVSVKYSNGGKLEIVGKLNAKTVGIVTPHTKNGKPWFRKVPYQFVEKAL